jgi:hypothetical protein
MTGLAHQDVDAWHEAGHERKVSGLLVFAARKSNTISA